MKYRLTVTFPDRVVTDVFEFHDPDPVRERERGEHGYTALMQIRKLARLAEKRFARFGAKVTWEELKEGDGAKPRQEEVP